MIMIIGIALLVICILLGWVLIPFIVVLLFMIMGVILILFSLLLIHMRATQSTLGYLLEDPVRGTVHWAYVYGDYDIRITPALRQLEKHSYSKKLDQQIQEFKTYNLAGHKIRIVPEGIGHSIDLGNCLYANFAKRAWNTKTLIELRNFVKLSKPKAQEEKPETLEQYQKLKEEHEKEQKTKEKEATA